MYYSEREKEKVIEEYKESFRELEERFNAAQHQLDDAKAAADEHEKLRHERDTAIEQWKRDRKLFDARIRKAQDELEKLGEEKRESKKLFDMKQKSDRKIECLREEVCRMRSEKDQIGKTLDKDHRRYQLELQARQREINDRTRQAEALKRKVRQLEQRSEIQQRKLLEQSNKNKALRRVKSAGHSRPRTERPAAPRSARPIRPQQEGLTPQGCIKEFRTMLDEALVAKKASGRLARALHQKEELNSMKKQVERQRQSLEFEKQRQRYCWIRT